jgi:hypothetical protein
MGEAQTTHKLNGDIHMKPFGRRHLCIAAAALGLSLATTTAFADPQCGSKTIQVTGWGSNWVQINLSTLLTLSDESGVNARREASYLNVGVNNELEFFTIRIGGADERLAGGEQRTFAIPGPTSSYQTFITWCFKR